MKRLIVSGVYSNDLTNQNPDQAHAVLTEKANGNYASVYERSNNKKGAARSSVCGSFTGGGRECAGYQRSANGDA